MTKLRGRIQKLEKAFQLGPPTEFDRYLRLRLEAARRRVGLATGPRQDGAGNNLTSSAMPYKEANDLASRLLRARERFRHQNRDESGQGTTEIVENENVLCLGGRR